MSKNPDIINKLKKRNAQSALKEAEERRKNNKNKKAVKEIDGSCLLYTSPSPRDRTRSRMPSSA